jgi:hypothetical protein
LEVPESGGVFSLDPRWSVEYLARDLLGDVAPSEGPALLRRMGQNDSGLVLAARSVARLRPEDDSETTNGEPPKGITWADAARETARELVVERLTIASDQLADVSDEVFQLIWVWRQLDPEGLRVWLREQVDSGRWPLLEVLGRLVPIGVRMGGPPHRILGDLSLGVVDELLGLDHILESLAEQIEAVEVHSGPRVEDPTPDQREQYVLGVLRSERDRKLAESGLHDGEGNEHGPVQTTAADTESESGSGA